MTKYFSIVERKDLSIQNPIFSENILLEKRRKQEILRWMESNSNITCLKEWFKN